MQLKNERGLTAYGLSCGYQEHTEIKNMCSGAVCSVRLYREHGTYHLIVMNDARRLIWHSFRTFTQAKRAYKTALRQVRTGILY